MSDNSVTGREHYLHIGKRWGEKAEQNIENWGEQSVETLLLATQEELGELTRAVLENREEDGYYGPIYEELDDLAALLFQLRWALNRHDLDTGNCRDEDGGPQ